MDYTQAMRLVRELRDITLHPEKHDQATWIEAEKNPELNPISACGTTGCLAGNAVLNSGAKLVWSAVEKYDDRQGRWVPSGRFKAADCVVDGSLMSVSRRARELFGLSGSEADRMFDPDNSIQRLWELAIDFSEGMVDPSDALAAFGQALRLKDNKIDAAKDALKDAQDAVKNALALIEN